MWSCKTKPSKSCPVCKGTGRNHHNGVDFGDKPFGFPVTTPRSGVVTARATQRDSAGRIVGAGHYVGVRVDGMSVIMCFFHLQMQAVQIGDRVKRGDVIGYNGSSGNSTGAHLHFELRKGTTGLGSGVWGDPATFLLEPVEPVKPSTKFTPADWIETTVNLNLRRDPGIGSSVVMVVDAGTVGQIMPHGDNGKSVNGHHWWFVDMDAGRLGWMTESYLVATPPPELEHPAEPDPPTDEPAPAEPEPTPEPPSAEPEPPILEPDPPVDDPPSEPEPEPPVVPDEPTTDELPTPESITDFFRWLWTVLKSLLNQR